MRPFPGFLLRRCLLAALLLEALLRPGGAAAQSAPTTGGSAPAQPGYIPLQYIPASQGVAPSSDPYTTQNQTPADTENAQTPAAQTPAPPASPDAPPISFQPLTASTRPNNPDSGFAPVVGTIRDLDGSENTRLVNSAGGLPRLYAPGFRVGPFDVRPDASLEETYNDNIYLSPRGTPHTSDFILDINPSLSASYSSGSPGEIDGTELGLYYAPTGLIFSENGDNSAINQQLNASLTHRFTRLAIGVNENYSYTSGGEIQAGNLVNQTIYTTSMDVDYAATAKTSLEVAAAYSVNRYTLGYGSNDLSAIGYLNYELRPKVTVSIGPSFDYLTSENGTGAQEAFGAVFRIAYAYSAKTAIYAQIGGDDRTYSGSTLSNLELNYLAGVSWDVGPKTSLALTASRATDSSSISLQEDYIASDFGMTIKQILVDRFSIQATLGYENSQYFSTISGADTLSNDYISISPALVFHPTIWSDVGLSYLYREELTSNGADQFVNNQVTIFSTVRF